MFDLIHVLIHTAVRETCYVQSSTALFCLIFVRWVLDVAFYRRLKGNSTRFNALGSTLACHQKPNSRRKINYTSGNIELYTIVYTTCKLAWVIGISAELYIKEQYSPSLFLNFSSRCATSFACWSLNAWNSRCASSSWHCRLWRT